MPGRRERISPVLEAMAVASSPRSARKSQASGGNRFSITNLLQKPAATKAADSSYSVRPIRELRDLSAEELRDELRMLGVTPPAQQYNEAGAHAECLFLLSAVRIQRVHREIMYCFSKFGPMLLCRAGGQPSDYGRIAFAAGKATGRSVRPAPYAVVSDQSSPDLIAKFMEKCALRTRRAPRACPRTTSHRTTHRRPPCARACSSCPPQDVEAPQAGGRHHDARRRAGLPPGAAPLAHL